MNKIMERCLYSVCFAAAVLSAHIVNLRIDSDILWSIAVGKWITFNRAFPSVDCFSWTIYGKEWITHEWFFAFLAYKFNDMWGSLGLYILAGIPIIITVYILYIIGQKYDENRSFTFVLILSFGIISLYRLCIPFRAYIFALLFFTLMIYLLYFKNEKAIDWLYIAGLFMIWANFHASVCMGYIILFVEMIRRLIIYKKPAAIWIIVTSFLATLVNPYGFKIWTYFWFTLSEMGEAKNIAEWQPPDFNDIRILLFYLILASSVIILQYIFEKYSQLNSRDMGGIVEPVVPDSANPFRRAVRIFFGFMNKYITVKTCLLVLFWGFYIYSLYTIRMVFYAIIMWIIITSYYVGKTHKLKFTNRVNYIFVSLFIVFLACNFINADMSIKNIIESDNEISPVEEVNFLKENPDFQYHLFNEYIFGGYLILNDIPVFIDARCDSYIKFGIQKKYCNIILLQEDPQKILEELGVKNILILNDSPFARYLMVNKAWKLIYKGSTASIFTISD